MFHLRVRFRQAPVCGVKQGAPLWQFELAIYEADVALVYFYQDHPADQNWYFPLINIQKTMEHHLFSWINQLE